MSVKHSPGSLMVVGVMGLLVQACSHAPLTLQESSVSPVVAEKSSAAQENAVLAGEWEYEEGGMVVTLRLDRFGNGTYEFKDGRFRTDLLADHRWSGKWAQQENDREGGFEIALSPDYSEGDGRWWYTRIEGDTAPIKPGGRFHVMKVQSTVQNQALPAERSSQ
ncbi:MAG: hypothetical protein UZ03_NOB001003323 [Nitrospira sp. OLB3]|nr:MAG: hypothetical protein UZ03_NOB001003323 [Nitrospira sp. OLB3]RIK61281.1 MAG: hypothetical protein DCC63_00645 [Nitrospira sp.]